MALSKKLGQRKETDKPASEQKCSTAMKELAPYPHWQHHHPQ
jgi:hypothetical protein